MRKRLDFERPVERELLMECLDIALQAPTGSNSQGWQWVFVTDEAKKREIRDIYHANFQLYRQMPRPSYEAGDPRADRERHAWSTRPTTSRRKFHRVPVLLVPCLAGKPADSSGGGASFWGSLLPAVWSFMLALHEPRPRLGVDHPASPQRR